MKITNLDPLVALGGTATLPVVQGGKSWRVALGQIMRGGPMANGVWVRAPAIPKILLDGNGTVVIDMITANGTITAGVASFNPTGPAEDWLYFEGAVAFRGTFTGTATAEII